MCHVGKRIGKLGIELVPLVPSTEQRSVKLFSKVSGARQLQCPSLLPPLEECSSKKALSQEHFLPDVLKEIRVRPLVPRQLIPSVRETLEIWGWVWLLWKPSEWLSFNSLIKNKILQRQINVNLYFYCPSVGSAGYDTFQPVMGSLFHR